MSFRGIILLLIGIWGSVYCSNAQTSVETVSTGQYKMLDSLPRLIFTDISSEHYKEYEHVPQDTLVQDSTQLVFQDSLMSVNTSGGTLQYRTLTEADKDFPYGIEWTDYEGYLKTVDMLLFYTCIQSEWTFCQPFLVDRKHNTFYDLNIDFEHGLIGPVVSPTKEYIAFAEITFFGENKSGILWILKKEMENGTPVYREYAFAMVGKFPLGTDKYEPSINHSGQIQEIQWTNDSEIAVKVLLRGYDEIKGRSHKTNGYFLSKLP